MCREGAHGSRCNVNPSNTTGPCLRDDQRGLVAVQRNTLGDAKRSVRTNTIGGTIRGASRDDDRVTIGRCDLDHRVPHRHIQQSAVAAKADVPTVGRERGERADIGGGDHNLSDVELIVLSDKQHPVGIGYAYRASECCCRANTIRIPPARCVSGKRRDAVGGKGKSADEASEVVTRVNHVIRGVACDAPRVIKARSRANIVCCSRCSITTPCDQLRAAVAEQTVQCAQVIGRVHSTPIPIDRHVNDARSTSDGTHLAYLKHPMCL